MPTNASSRPKPRSGGTSGARLSRLKNDVRPASSTANAPSSARALRRRGGVDRERMPRRGRAAGRERGDGEPEVDGLEQGGAGRAERFAQAGGHRHELERRARGEDGQRREHRPVTDPGHRHVARPPEEHEAEGRGAGRERHVGPGVRRPEGQRTPGDERDGREEQGAGPAVERRIRSCGGLSGHRRTRSVGRSTGRAGCAWPAGAGAGPGSACGAG